MGIPAIAGLLAVPVGVLIFVVVLAVLGRRWVVAEPGPALADLPEDPPYDNPTPHDVRPLYPSEPAAPYGYGTRPAERFAPREPAQERPFPGPWSPQGPYGTG